MTDKFLNDRLFTKDLAVLFISGFSQCKKNLVSFAVKNVFKYEVLKQPIKDVDDLDQVWCYLSNKYNDVHILSFKGLNGEFETINTQEK